MTPPLDPALRERLGRIHTGSLSDAMGSFGVPAPGLRPITPGARLLGPAYTVKCYPGSILTVHKALLEAPPGVVLVVDDEGDTRGALWGEVMTHQAIRQGLLGLVTDGPVRDTVEIAALGFPVFAGSISPRVGTNRRVGLTQVPIALGGCPSTPTTWSWRTRTGSSSSPGGRWGGWWSGPRASSDGTRASSARSARGSSWWICCSSGSWSPAAGSSMGGNA